MGRVRWLAAVITLGWTSAAHAQGVDETCLLALTKFDPATLNLAFPDDSAQYYNGGFGLPPGTRVRLTGRFPHARYMSFNVYDPQLRPVDALADVEIRPDAGSANPFARGADRTSDARSYTVFIEPTAPPAQRAPNTLYTGAANPTGIFIYRIYVPDRDTNDTGDAGLPTVTVEPAGASASPSPSPCTNFSKPSVSGLNELLASLSPPAGVAIPGGTDPPKWRKFVNLLSSVAVNLTGTPSPGGIDLDATGGSGGFLSNRDNAYVSAPVNRGLGPIVVTRLRAPTFPDTRAGTKTMPGGELRYWSVCQNDPLTQRFVGCVNDDRAVQTADGFATIVVSTPAARPPAATTKCGVNWLPWGPNPRGVLIYRHMLPDPAFTAAVQRAKVDHEADTMGAYLPASRYYADAAAYARSVGCPGPAGPSTTRAACVSRRVVTIRLRRSPGRARTVTVRVSGRPARRVRVRGRRVRVDLRRVPQGRYVVRVTAGKRTLDRRVYRTCRTRSSSA